MKQKNAGFTLIELLVVLFITTMISGIAVANYRAAEKQKRAVIASDTVINALRNAQNFTLTGKSTNNSDPTCRVPLYYQVVFTYSGSINLYGHNVKCNNDDLIESYTLPVNTRIKAGSMILTPLLAGITAATNLTFRFTPPFASITAATDNGTPAIFTTSTITVETTDGQASKTITVDGVAGRIGQ
ncbi:MAG: type II secretion system protein [Candidatus Doudnabacteria bacterium]